MIKKISCLILAIALFLINTNIIYALEIYEDNSYSIYFNNIKSNVEYKVAKVGEGDRVFYDLDGIIQILQSKGGTNTKVYKLGESLDEDAVKTSISKISSELGETIEDNNIQALTDYTGIKEKDTIAIATKLNNNLIYGITNEIGTNKFIPFAIIKYNIYVEEDSNIEEEQYETILFSKVDIGSDVESYIDSGKVYYPIRFISLLLGGDITMFYSSDTGRDKTGISVDFDIKEKYKYEKIFSNKEDEKNNTLSKNQCLNVKIKQQVENQENIVGGRIYNLDNNELILVQNANLDKIIKDNDELEVFKEKSNTISICNIEEKIDIEDIQFDVFIGSDKENFVPTNLTIKEDNIVIKNNDSISINISSDSKIKNITFKKSDDTTISLDKEFEINTKEYQTNETLSNSIENVYYTIEYENGETSDGYVYLEPKKKNTTVKISDYTFIILRNEKDSNTKLKSIKYKKTSETEWIDLPINSEGKYVVDALYSDYELLLQTYKETSSVTVESGTVTKVDDGYKLIPNSNIQTFNVVAEDGTSIKYSVTFNEEVEKETITSVEVEQGETRYTAKGPDENNQFTVEEFDKSKGEGVKIKYKTSSGEEKETGVFVPNSDNNNTGMLYVKNNTYTVLFKEKENVPDESTETIPNDGGGNGGGSVVGGGGSPTDDNNTPVTPVTCDGNLNKSIKTKGSNVNIRNEASTANGSKSIIESVADSGTKLSAVKEEGEWYMVKLPSDNTKCGWISKTVIENSNTGKGFDCDTSKLDHYMVTGTNANYSDLNTNVISKRNQGVKVYGELCSTTKNETNKKQCQVIADKYKRKLENWYIVKYNDEKNKCGFMYKDQLTEYNKGVAKIALDRCSNNKTLIDSWIKANKSSSKRTKVKDEYLTNMTINSKPLYNYIKYNNADQNSFWLQAGFFKSDYEKTWSKIHLINVLALERGSNTGNIEYLLTYGTLPGTIKSTFNEDVQGYRVHEVIAQCVNNLFKAAKNKGNSNSDSGSQSLLACCNSPKNKDIFLRTETYVSITCYADFDLDIDASDKALCK